MSLSTEVSTNPFAARFQLIAAPMASPACCGICGISNCDDGFVTLDLDFEFYGTLIFCRNCALSVAAPVGGIAPEQAVKLATEVAEQAALINSLQERLRILLPIEEYINDRLDSTSGDVPVDIDRGNVRSLLQPEELAPESDVSNSDAESTDNDVTELGSVERSDDSSNVSSDLSELLGELG